MEVLYHGIKTRYAYDLPLCFPHELLMSLRSIYHMQCWSGGDKILKFVPRMHNIILPTYANDCMQSSLHLLVETSLVSYTVCYQVRHRPPIVLQCTMF